jgi:hypothetical protein
VDDEPITSAQPVHADVSVEYGMGGAVIRAHSRAGEEWIVRNTVPAGRDFALGLVVDGKAVGDVIRAMQRDGLTVHCGEASDVGRPASERAG